MKTFLTNEEREARDVINSQWFAKFQTYDWDNMDKRDRKRAYKDVYKTFKQSIPLWYKIMIFFFYFILFIGGILAFIVLLTKSHATGYTALGRTSDVLAWSLSIFFAYIIFGNLVIKRSKHTKDWHFFEDFMSSYK